MNDAIYHQACRISKSCAKDWWPTKCNPTAQSLCRGWTSCSQSILRI